ncbi:MAG: NAD(P)/FAD-dependent oxidoreductase [Myxococcota bacterium]|nr:NAD(P)/FAD-dependent oxidoreductase [Myxococcota bacterium]
MLDEKGEYDAVVVGSGPNGFSAAIYLAQQGCRVCLIEGKPSVGGGMRTRELTRPGFRHDICSAAHPMAILSPFMKRLPLADFGLEWIEPPAAFSHPLDDEKSVIMWSDLQRTAGQMGADSHAYRRLVEPFLKNPDVLFEDLLAPLKWPKAPLQMLRFGLSAIRSATGFANSRFKGPQAKALFAGCAAHSIMDLDRPLTAALGLIFSISGHLTNWPIVRGGTEGLTVALSRYFESLGGQIITNHHVQNPSDLPRSRVYLFDTSPQQLVDINRPHLPERYCRRLSRYRYGPGVFKIDWALREPIPWRDPMTAQAATVHIGGSMHDIAAAEKAMWLGQHPEKPFVLLCQQSLFDDTRAPSGHHTGYAYCHVPAGSIQDQTQAIESQVERFAPGFRDIIIERHVMNTQALTRHNPNYIGGAIAGGIADWRQLFSRPVLRLNPYTTPNPRIFICSSSTPPGGGVHGMCGFYAARTAFRRLHRLEINSLS